MKETRILDDAARTAGVHGPGLPIRAGAEVFTLSRFTKQIRNDFVQWVRERYENELRRMASLATPEAYAKMVDKYHEDVRAGLWGYGGQRYSEFGDSHEANEQLILMLLMTHHPDITEEMVAWLMSLWTCPACDWRGVRPEQEAGTRCRACHKTPPEPPPPVVPKEGTNPYDKGQGSPPLLCCKKMDQRAYYWCPQPKCTTSNVELESVQLKLFAGIRELQSADPRTPPRGCDTNGAGGVANSTRPSAD